MSSKVSPTEYINNMENKSMDTIGRSNLFMQNDREQQLYCYYWNPIKTKPVRALVYICHGFTEHLEYYDELAMKFAAIGIFAFGHDHIGHGKSDGYRCQISDFNEYSTDVLLHCEKMIKKYSGLKCFIVGHSMGGMITVLSALKKPDMFSGVVLMAPLIRPNPQEATPFRVCVAKAISSIFPFFPVGYLNEKHVTRDTEMIQKLHEDPIRYHGAIRARWAVACLDGLMYLSPLFEQIQWPFLLLQGDKDYICDTEAAFEFYTRANSKDKEIKIFPDAYHNLYIEYPDIRKQALQDTVDWIKDRL